MPGRRSRWCTRPGAVCLYVEGEASLFSGDTQFQGRWGVPYSDYPTIVASIRERLLSLPEETKVNTGHGDYTTIAAERAASSDW